MTTLVNFFFFCADSCSMTPMQKAILAIAVILAAGGIALLAACVHAPGIQHAVPPDQDVFFRSVAEGFEDRIIIHLIPVGGNVETCLASWSVAEDGNILIDRKDQRISRVTTEDHIILEVPRRAQSEYTVNMIIRSPDGRELDNSSLRIGPLAPATQETSGGE